MQPAPLLSIEAVALKSLWRNYTCYHLDTPFTPPENSTLQRALTERVRLALHADSIQTVFKPLGDAAWICIFFHQANRDHHAATYENGTLGHVSYWPRCAAVFVFDPAHHILYLSHGEKGDAQSLLSALAGVLIPPEEEAPLPRPYSFDLSCVPYLGETFRRPEFGSAAWNVLKLKSLNTILPGEGGNSQEYRSATDLLESPDFFSEHFCETFQNMTFSVYIPFRKRPHTLQIFDRSNCIRATLTADTLDSIASITSTLEPEINLKDKKSCDLLPDLA